MVGPGATDKKKNQNFPKWQASNWANATLDFTGSYQLQYNVKFPPRYLLEAGRRVNEAEVGAAIVSAKE